VRCNVQSEDADQEGEPDRIGAVEQKTLHRGKIYPEQPYPKKEFCERFGLSEFGRNREISQRRDHENRRDQDKTGNPHRKGVVEVSVVAVCGAGSPFDLTVLNQTLDGIRSPKRSKAISKPGTKLER